MYYKEYITEVHESRVLLPCALQSGYRRGRIPALGARMHASHNNEVAFLHVGIHMLHAPSPAAYTNVFILSHIALLLLYHILDRASAIAIAGCLASMSRSSVYLQGIYTVGPYAS